MLRSKKRSYALFVLAAAWQLFRIRCIRVGQMEEYDMNEAQIRRMELLKQAKQLYGERERIPPVHPRYGNLCKESQESEDKQEAETGSFYMRLVIGILCFIFFVYMDQNGAEVANVNSAKILNEIERDVDVETIYLLEVIP